MTELRDKLAVWLTKSLYEGITEDIQDDFGDREATLFEALHVVTDSEHLPNRIADLEDITLSELRSVVIFLKSSRHPGFHEDRIKAVLDVTLTAIDAAAVFTSTEGVDNVSNKRQRIN